jgi:hypothetical protein
MTETNFIVIPRIRLLNSPRCVMAVLCVWLFTMPLAAQPDTTKPTETKSTEIKPIEAKQIATFQRASALAINPALEEVYVLDLGNFKLFRLGFDGKFLNSVGGFGVDAEAFDTPKDLTTDGMSIFVADRGNQRIAQFDRYLNFKVILQNRPDAASPFANETGNASLSEQLWRPVSVSVSTQGDLYLLEESQRQAIRINPFQFASQLQLKQNPVLNTFGGINGGKGALKDPIRLQATKSGKVFIDDDGYHTVMVYDLFGNFVTKIGDNLLVHPGAMAAGEVSVKNDANEPTLVEWLGVIDGKQIYFFETAQQSAFRLAGKITSETVMKITGNTSTLMDIGLHHDTLFLLTETGLYSTPLSALPLVQP